MHNEHHDQCLYQSKVRSAVRWLCQRKSNYWSWIAHVRRRSGNIRLTPLCIYKLEKSRTRVGAHYERSKAGVMKTCDSVQYLTRARSGDLETWQHARDRWYGVAQSAGPWPPRRLMLHVIHVFAPPDFDRSQCPPRLENCSGAERIVFVVDLTKLELISS